VTHTHIPDQVFGRPDGAGFVVATLDYRLVPGYHRPAPVDDVIAAGEFLRTEAERFALDPDSIGV